MNPLSKYHQVRRFAILGLLLILILVAAIAHTNAGQPLVSSIVSVMIQSDTISGNDSCAVDNSKSESLLYKGKDQQWYDSCHQARPFCGSGVYSMKIGGTQYAYMSYECCAGENALNCCAYYWCNNAYVCINPRWFYTRIETSGTIKLLVRCIPSKNIDLICYGPFSTPTDACVESLTLDNIVDCSSTYSAPDTCIIPNAQVGEYYLIILASPTTLVDLFFSQFNIGEPGAGTTSCDIVNHCTILELSALPGVCNPLTNTFRITGKIYFTNQPPSGQLVVYDNISGSSSVYNGPFTSPMSYSLDGITCDNQLHTITASFWDSAYCELQKSVQAPVLCPNAVISGGGSVCDDGTTLPISINFSPATLPISFSYARNGIPIGNITGYNGPFPYQFFTNQPGVYTLVNSINTYCSGSLSGEATIAVNPIPQVHLGVDILACYDEPVVLDAGEGFVSYMWQPGLETSRVIAPKTAGIFRVTVTDNNGCHGSDEVTISRRPPITNKQIKHN